MSNMQSEENFNTYLTQEESWAAFYEGPESPSISRGMESLADSMGMQSATLVSLLEKTTDGTWPIRIAGEFFRTSSLSLGSGGRIVLLRPSNPDDTAELLQSITGEELFLLCSSDGKILTQSEQTISIFGENRQLAGLFDSASSGAVQTAIRRCALEGHVPEFLVSHTSNSGHRANYGVTMRRLQTPGRLVFCRLQVPSVAVVTGKMDRNSLIRTLLEESFCPNITLNSEGIITSMNQVARDISMKLWGSDPTGSLFFNMIHPDQRDAVRDRHEQRKKGVAVPSRYNIQLSGGRGDVAESIDVSVIPLHGLDLWVAFLRPVSPAAQPSGEESRENLLPRGFQDLLEKDMITPDEVLVQLAGFTNASAAAYVNRWKHNDRR